MKKKTRFVKVALIKAFSQWGNQGANMKLFKSLITPLEKAKVDILVTPECFLDGYMVRDKKCTPKKLVDRCVSGPSDPIIKCVRETAKKMNIHIVLGASEKGRDGVIRNAAYLLGRAGEHLGTYYKVTGGKFYEPGSDLPVFETDFGKVGIIICADRRWPENVRCLRLKGAEIILNPTWGMVRGLNTSIIQTRAHENGIPVCFTHPDQSLICDQEGNIAAILESNVPDVLIHDIDLSKNIEIGTDKDPSAGPPIRNRRPELYHSMVEPVIKAG